MKKGIIAVVDPKEEVEYRKYDESDDSLFFFLSSLFDEVYGDPVMIPSPSFSDLYRYILEEGVIPTLVAVYVRGEEDVDAAKKFSGKYPGTKVILFPGFKLSYESNLMQVLFLQEVEK